MRRRVNAQWKEKKIGAKGKDRNLILKNTAASDGRTPPTHHNAEIPCLDGNGWNRLLWDEAGEIGACDGPTRGYTDWEITALGDMHDVMKNRENRDPCSQHFIRFL